MDDRNISGPGASNINRADQDHAIAREQELLLPIANVGRIMKQILPPNAKISKESKETMQECVSEFISFVTGEASDKCRKERRKTINGDDVCWALQALGFDYYAGPLRRYLHKYREIEVDRVNQEKARNGHDPQGNYDNDLRLMNQNDHELDGRRRSVEEDDTDA